MKWQPIEIVPVGQDMMIFGRFWHRDGRRWHYKYVLDSVFRCRDGSFITSSSHLFRFPDDRFTDEHLVPLAWYDVPNCPESLIPPEPDEDDK